VAVAASGATLVVNRWRSGASVSAIARDVGLTFALRGLDSFRILSWTRAYYGDFVPNTFYAKAAYGVASRRRNGLTFSPFFNLPLRP